MYMSYTNNPHMPRLRMQAAKLVLEKGLSTREAAKYTGFNQSSIVRWVKEAKVSNLLTIPTQSSRPNHHPNEIPSEIRQRILSMRIERDQCADILHHRLRQEGLEVSLSSVKRTLKRNNLSRFSPNKKWHQSLPRPVPEKPGILVEIDTTWDVKDNLRLYVYTLLDVCSRWAFAYPSLVSNTATSITFLKKAKLAAPFSFQTIQTDHGSEFAKRFTQRAEYQGFTHRHTRIRTPNDNAHLERFNRTIQQECLYRIPRSLKSYQKNIPEYLEYYNTQRPHMGLAMKTPLEVMQSY